MRYFVALLTVVFPITSLCADEEFEKHIRPFLPIIASNVTAPRSNRATFGSTHGRHC